MVKNPIQFRKGLSLPDFLKPWHRRTVPEQCRRAVYGWRWPKGLR